jgi:acyl-coenzyme A synthetase/AMP-(fatty) acid ligase
MLVQPGKRTIAAPDVIQFAPGLRKIRSGKIMRRILRKIAENLVRLAIRSPIRRWSKI